MKVSVNRILHTRLNPPNCNPSDNSQTQMTSQVESKSANGNKFEHGTVRPQESFDASEDQESVSS